MSSRCWGAERDGRSALLRRSLRTRLDVRTRQPGRRGWWPPWSSRCPLFRWLWRFWIVPFRFCCVTLLAPFRFVMGGRPSGEQGSCRMLALRLAERQGVESARELGGVAGTGHAQQGERELQVALIEGFRMQRATRQCSWEHVAHSRLLRAEGVAMSARVEYCERSEAISLLRRLRRHLCWGRFPARPSWIPAFARMTAC